MLAVEWCSLACVQMAAQDSRSAHRGLEFKPAPYVLFSVLTCCDGLACRRTAFESLFLRWMVPRVLIASSGSLAPERSWCYECVLHDPAAYLAGFFGPRACSRLSGGATARIGT